MKLDHANPFGGKNDLQSMMGDFDSISVRVFAEEVVRPIGTFPRALYDFNPILP
jgi:hypothetical protein